MSMLQHFTMLRPKVWAMPPQVENHPSYRTPEQENNRSKKSRLTLGCQAKSKARQKIGDTYVESRESLIIEGEGILLGLYCSYYVLMMLHVFNKYIFAIGDSHVMQVTKQLEIANNYMHAMIRNENEELMGYHIESRIDGKNISRQLFLTQHCQSHNISCVSRVNIEDLTATSMLVVILDRKKLPMKQQKPSVQYLATYLTSKTSFYYDMNLEEVRNRNIQRHMSYYT